jgi:hypothetical protein
MNNNRVSYDLTPANLHARMDPGHKYTVYQLAAKLRVATDDIRPLVKKLLDDAALVAYHAPRNIYYFKPVGDVAEVPAAPEFPIVLTVAAPPGPPDLTGVLSGYESQFARRMQLCMLARGAR